MKLFIVAALISLTTAGRLEHLERSYLPPDNNGQHNSVSSRSFQNPGNSFGTQESSQSSHNTLSSHGGFENSANNGFRLSASARTNSFDSDVHNSNGFHSGQGFNNGAFTAATTNQYLPPNNGPSISSSNGFGKSAMKPNFGSPRFESSPSFGSRTSGAQYNPHSHIRAAASRQYLTPKASPRIQSSLQQHFDEKTGYQY